MRGVLPLQTGRDGWQSPLTRRASLADELVTRMIVALLGLFTSLFAYRLAFPLPHQRRFDIWLVLLATHIAATIAYWLFTFEGGMDAFLYYRDPYGFINNSPLASGTDFIVHFVQFIKRTLGGSFLDHFLLFQCMGMIGIAFLARTFNEVAEEFGLTVPLHVYALLFLPGLHFWSVSIGKDAPVIMALGLAVWSSVRIERRYIGMAVAALILALIRPHVGAITVIGTLVAVLFTRQVSFRTKLLLFPIAIVGMSVLSVMTLDRLRISLDLQSISSFFEYQQELGQDFGSGADIQNLPFPLKVLTLLFRPFFFDAPGMMGYAASVENVALLWIIGYILFNWKIVFKLSTHVAYMAYCVVTSTILILLLSMVNYNVGLGQRQKMMAIPAILVIYGTLYLYKRYLAAYAAASALPVIEAEDTPRMSTA